LFLSTYSLLPLLHSFPTRRSSDLRSRTSSKSLAAASWSLCAPPSGSATISSTMPNSFKSLAVIFIAAAAMKITAKDLKELGIVDEIVAEPEGGAHSDHEAAARLLDEVLDRQLVALTNQPVPELLDARYDKFRKMGQFFDLGN